MRWRSSTSRSTGQGEPLFPELAQTQGSHVFQVRKEEESTTVFTHKRHRRGASATPLANQWLGKALKIEVTYMSL